jgi:hypothetical protein
VKRVTFFGEGKGRKGAREGREYENVDMIEGTFFDWVKRGGKGLGTGLGAGGGKGHAKYSRPHVPFAS